MIVTRNRNHSRQDEHHGVKTHPMAYSIDLHNRSHHISVPCVSIGDTHTRSSNPIALSADR
eukprot:6193209-Pleurochrysis_carterae.AAC.2